MLVCTTSDRPRSVHISLVKTSAHSITTMKLAASFTPNLHMSSAISTCVSTTYTSNYVDSAAWYYIYSTQNSHMHLCV